MDQQELTYLIKRYKSGTATREEISKLEKFWNEANRDTSFMDAHTTTELLETGRQMFNAIRYEIGKQERTIGIPLLSNPLFYRAAAAVLILLTVSIWSYVGLNRTTEIRTGFGERLTISLPDKSNVVLNGNSVLRYSGSWGEETTREVWIEGEGFFSVTHTQNHQKFIVHASDQLNVEVLGTKFNVKARHYVSEVMLTEGQVKLGLPENSEAAPVFLKPGELATKNDNRLSKRKVKQKQFTSWMEDKLFFERTPLSEVAIILKETYGLRVTFGDRELEKRELSGEISSATADDILYAIAETFSLKVEKDGQSVIISVKDN